jgi:hypothetical protein
VQAKFPPFTTQAPSDSRPSPTHEVSPVEAKLRTAMQYLYHSRQLIDEVLADLPAKPEVLPEPTPELVAEVIMQRMEASDDDTAAA